MAEPGDPPPPQDPSSGEDHDDLIGFATPASLQGERRPEPEPEFKPEPEPEPEPEVVAVEPDLFSAAPRPAAPETPAPPPVEPLEMAPRRRMDRRPPPPAGGMGLYAVYALILFAVPTFGVSALIALFAVTGRSGPDDGLSRSHFIYQQRTLWVAAIGALLGIILIIVNIGVFVLFALALWIVVRGAFGVIRLKAGQPIANPRGWLF